MVFLKHRYISNSTVTSADAVISAAQKMADSLKTKMNHHLSNKAITTFSNLQKIFVHAAANKKDSKDQAQHTLKKNMNHLPAPKLNPALASLSVASSISPPPLRDTDPPPRVAFIPPPRETTPLDMSPPTPSSTTNKGLLAGIDIPRVTLTQRFSNVPMAQTTEPLVPKAAPPRHSPCISALNIRNQYIREAETAAPPDL